MISHRFSGLGGLVRRAVRCGVRMFVIMGMLSPVAASGQEQSSGDVEARSRVAFVVGNASYATLNGVRYALSDVRAVAAALKQAKFDVTVVEDATREQMAAKFQKFINEIGPDSLPLVYFTGHGVQAGGSVYLLPQDMPQLKSSTPLAQRAIDLRSWIDMLNHSGAELSVFVIDANHGNPAKRGSGKQTENPYGILPVPLDVPGLMLIYCSDKREAVCMDNLYAGEPEGKSLFARAFIGAPGTPNLTLQQILERTTTDVAVKSRSMGLDQTPVVFDESIGTGVLVPSP